MGLKSLRGRFVAGRSEQLSEGLADPTEKKKGECWRVLRKKYSVLHIFVSANNSYRVGEFWILEIRCWICQSKIFVCLHVHWSFLGSLERRDRV